MARVSENMTLKIDASAATRVIRKAKRQLRGAGLVDRELQGLISDFGRLEVTHDRHADTWHMKVVDPDSETDAYDQPSRWAKASGKTFGGCCTKLKHAIRRQQRAEYKNR